VGDSDEQANWGIGKEEDLPNESIAIRTGTMSDDGMLRNAEQIERGSPGLWAICVAAHPTMTEEAIAASMLVSGRYMNVTTARAIRQEFSLVPDLTTKNETSALILLGERPDKTTWDRVRSCFPNPRKPNPAYGKGGQ